MDDTTGNGLRVPRADDPCSQEKSPDEASASGTRVVLKVTSTSSNNPGSSPSPAKEVPECSFRRGRERPVTARLPGSRCLSALRTRLSMKVGRWGGRGRLPSKFGSARVYPEPERAQSLAGGRRQSHHHHHHPQSSPNIVESKRHFQAGQQGPETRGPQRVSGEQT